MRRSLALAFGLSTLAGCSSSKPLTPGVPLTSEVPPAVCSGTGSHGDSASVMIDQVDATLKDPSGAPVVNLPVQVCGINQCVNGSTNAAGKTSVAPHSAFERPAFKYGDGFDFGELAVLLSGAPSQNLGELVALPLPAYADGAVFPKSGPVKSGDLTLFVDSGTTVVHDRLSYSDDAELVLRSTAVPVAQSSQALDLGFGFELAYAVAPIGTTFCPAARISVRNSLAWAPGTEVELFVQGLAVSEEWAAYGTWSKVGEASVSSDGSSIDTTSGGIPILSAIAVRRK
jgi:hypothetical protein